LACPSMGKKLFLLKKFNKTLYRHTDGQRIKF